MTVNRRQFLLLSGTVGGLGLAALAHRALTNSPAPAPTGQPAPQVTAASTPVAAAKAEAIGPKGLFAPERGDVRMAVISDMNSAYGSTDYEPEVLKAVQLLPEWQPDIVLAGGDMVAGQSPSLSSEQIKAMWDGFDRYVAAPLRKARLPFGFTLGNHDASGVLAISGKFLFRRDRDQASAYWNDPRHNPGLQFVDRAGFPFYYTFQHKQVFYLIWDGTTARIPAEQIAWAEKSLASPTAQAAKMRIVIGHLPLYAVAVGRDELGEILADGEKLRAMLERYQVHTYISGHDHAYYPAHKGKLELLHTGAIGSGPRPLLNSRLAPFKTITIVDVNLATATTVYTTYDMKTLQLVDQRQLPRLIPGPTGVVLRRDVQEQDLTAEERALTWTPG